MDKEIARVKRVDGGFILEPENARSCPLLEQLYGGDKSEVGQVIDMPLDALLQNIREVAPHEGLSVRICGNLRAEPVLVLKKKPIEAQIPVRKIRGDGSHWGLTDLYPESNAALLSALKDGLPFDTGWWSSKKEIASARVCRLKRNGPITVGVSYEMDDPTDLADTAVWKAFGGNRTCSSGYDALSKLGFNDDEALQALEGLAEGYDPQTSESEERILHWKSGFGAVCKAIDNLADYCSSELEARYEGFVEYCREYIVSQKRQLGVSCKNCKHFHAGIGESRSHPADPADCGHPKYFALLSSNPAFPFAHGCKFWEIGDDGKRSS
jgi:hypothetical protein